MTVFKKAFKPEYTYHYRASVSSFKGKIFICFESSSGPKWKVLTLLNMTLVLNLLGNEEMQ